MSDIEHMEFSPEDVSIARMALLRAAGTEPRRLNTSEFVCSVSAEILALKNIGFVDSEIAAILERSVGKSISAGDIRQHCPSVDDLAMLEAQRALESARHQEKLPPVP